jgi:hypothetical protein
MLTLLLDVITCTVEEKGDKKEKKKPSGDAQTKKVETE